MFLNFEIYIIHHLPVVILAQWKFICPKAAGCEGEVRSAAKYRSDSVARSSRNWCWCMCY